MSSPYEWSQRQFNDAEAEFNRFFDRERDCNPSVEKVYRRLYVIFLLYKRPELQKFLASQYSEAALSLFFDSYIALRTTQISSAILTLRAALDQIIKGWCQAGGLQFDPTRFKQNRLDLTSKILQDLSVNNSPLCAKFQAASDRLQNEFGEASKITHHLSVSNHSTNGFLFDSLHQSASEVDDAVIYIQEVLENVLIMTIVICKKSLELWDSTELKKILKLTLSPNKTETIVKLCKQKNPE